MTHPTSQGTVPVETSGQHVTRDAISKFYDDFQPRLIDGYVYGNRRVSAAVERVCSNVQKSHKTILDVGCGIGTSSSQFAENLSWVTVLGIDISPNNIRGASRLFSCDRVRFACSDLTTPPDGAPFDVIALIDVYEHIPRINWGSFNRMLSNCLSSNGVIIITTPSPFHQRYLERNNPSGLQIVDETVMLEDVLALRTAIGGVLVCYQYMSIWNTNDYLHVVIDRNPQYVPSPSPRTSVWRRACSYLCTAGGRDIRRRRKLVRRLLGSKT